MMHGDSSKKGYRVLVMRDSAGTSEANVFHAHAPPQGPRETLMCVLKILANGQTGGDNLVHTISECLQERS